uniref:U4-Saltitoxin-Pre1a_1 n=1 Tax=Phidippus regius TaxID=1905328 RepID=A0A482ZBY9_9ARAC
MSSAAQIILLLGITLLCFQAYGYTYTGRTDTKNGYCEGSFGRIAVGEVGYDKDECEKILCHHEMKEVHGCGVVFVPPDCELVSGEGNYPDCCPMPKCPSD